MDEDIQEIWDTARRISCVWTTQFEKIVNFKPFQVSMLDVISTNFQGDDIKCWMDIRKGVYPKVTELDETVSIGEKISLLIYLQDSENSADIGIRDCWAYGGEVGKDGEKPGVQLTSENGCLMRPKLMQRWKKSFAQIDSKDTLVAHATVFAFKFPDQAYVHMTCNVEICYGKCKQHCDEEEYIGVPELVLNAADQFEVSSIETSKSLERQEKGEIKTLTDLPGEKSRSFTSDIKEKELRQPIDLGEKEAIVTPAKPLAKIRIPPSSLDITQKKKDLPFFQEDVGKTRENLEKIKQDRPGLQPTKEPESPVRIIKQEVQAIRKDLPVDKCQGNLDCLSKDRCHPGSTDPKCLAQPLTSPDSDDLCRENPNNPKCLSKKCHPGSSDSRCLEKAEYFFKHSDELPPESIEADSQEESGCVHGSKDPKCSEKLKHLPKPKEKISSQISKTEKPIQKELRKIICLEGSNDPRCDRPLSVQQIKEPDHNWRNLKFTKFRDSCFPGSLDPKCLRCDFNPNDARCKTLQKNDRCSPGSKNKNCYTPTKPTHATIRPKVFIQRCPPGSVDPRCTWFFTSVKTIDCSKHAYHPACTNDKKIIRGCFPGSKDEECIDQSVEKTYSEEKTFVCTGNSKDRRCLEESSLKKICDPSSQDPECIGISIPKDCSPDDEGLDCKRVPYECSKGSLDPRCKKEDEEVGEDGCHSNSKDPRCFKPPKIKESEECKNTGDPHCQFTEKEKPTGELVKETECTVGSRDPKCITASFVDITCTKGSKDPRCWPTEKPTPFEVAKLVDQIHPFACSENSNDPKCITASFVDITCIKGSKDPRCWPTEKPTPFEVAKLVHQIHPFACSENSNDPKCITASFVDITCTKGSKDPRCWPTEKPTPFEVAKLVHQIHPFACSENSNDPRCKGENALFIDCSSQPNDSLCKFNLAKIKKCNEDSVDPECVKQSSDIKCDTNSNDPRCAVVDTPLTPHIKGTTATKPSDGCVNGSTDPNCIIQISDIICDSLSTDPRCHGTPKIPKTKEALKDACTKDSKDPKCRTRKVPKPPGPRKPKEFDHVKCTKDSTDPRCLGEFARIGIEKEKCSEGSTDPECKKSCDPSSNDRRCHPEENWPLSKSLESFECAEDSSHPRCQYKHKTSPTTDSLDCDNNSEHPDCLTDTDTSVICYPGSTDPKCRFGKKVKHGRKKIKEFKCTVDSTNPRCLQKQTHPTYSSESSRSPEISSEERCFPGSKNPRCKTNLSRCYPGSDNPRCKKRKRPQPSFGSRIKSQSKIRKPSRGRPTSKGGKMMSKGDDDFHGDKDPRYHAFHSWLYEPPPRPRPRGRRSLDEVNSFFVHFDGKDVAVAPRQTEDDKDSSEESEESDESKKMGRRKHIVVDAKTLQYLKEKYSQSVKGLTENVPLLEVKNQSDKSSPSELLYTSSYLFVFISVGCFFIFVVAMHTFRSRKEMYPSYEV